LELVRDLVFGAWDFPATLLMSVAGVVLAAGRGSRMGGPKALVEFEGESFLGRVVKSMRRGGVGPITVVVAEGMADVAEESRAAGADVVANPHPERGQLSSFEVGVGVLGSGCLGAVVALVDHPLVRPGTYRAVAQALREHEEAFVVPLFGGRRGHPLGMGRRWFGELSRVPEGEGARWLLRRYADHVVEVATNDPGILLDIDTGEDLDRALRQISGAGSEEGPS
jgi:CTP:molybdopterin cytidylyltransferase MocA